MLREPLHSSHSYQWSFSGAPFCLIACSKNLRCRGLVAMGPQQEIDGVACLVDARYRYFHSPLTLTYVSSIRQLRTRALGAPKRLLQHWQQFDRPAVHGRVITEITLAIISSKSKTSEYRYTRHQAESPQMECRRFRTFAITGSTPVSSSTPRFQCKE